MGDVKAGELRIRRAVDRAGNVGLPKHDKTRDVPLSPAELDRMPRRALWIVSRLDGEYSPTAMRSMRFVVCTHERRQNPGKRNGASADRGTRIRHTFGIECATRGVPITKTTRR